VTLNLLAAGVQQSSVTLEFAGLPLDHNGVFHLVQLVAVVVLTVGVLRGLTPVKLPERP